MKKLIFILMLLLPQTFQASFFDEWKAKAQKTFHELFQDSPPDQPLQLLHESPPPIITICSDNKQCPLLSKKQRLQKLIEQQQNHHRAKDCLDAWLQFAHLVRQEKLRKLSEKDGFVFIK